MGARPGEDAPRAKLTWLQVTLIRATYRTGRISMRQLGELFGVRKQTVEKILNFETWK